ncbi:hypothetical protein TRVA0_008S00518 [Trichomonascus vanleenenianus]|uniref:molybdenum cofactor biosynthesis protein MoaE n=1 Tax=Trichomonascus vanleenenianus TaxID=2268995 RepID=UPI003EC9F35D
MVKTERVWAFLTDGAIDRNSLIEFVKSPEAGAVITFGGTTRDSMDGKEVVHLSYDAHVGMATKRFEKIANEALKRWEAKPENKAHVVKVAIAHRLGVVPVMEESIVVAVSSAHRQEGWAAAEWILEEIKAKAEIWKNEQYSDGSAVWRANVEDDRK